MCITAKPAELSSTYVGVLVNFKKGTHTLMYQNKMENRATGTNCMILPILGEISSPLVDTTAYGNFMKEIVTATTPVNRSFGGGDMVAKGVTVQKVGKYEIVIAKDASTAAIKEALESLDVSKRPEISVELLDRYQEFYSNPTLVICCFSNKDAEISQPIMVEYIPRDMSKIFLPGADSHDGSVPKMGEDVDRDHSLVIGIIPIGETKPYGMYPVTFTQKVPAEIANAYWVGIQPAINGINADWQCSVEESGFGKMNYLILDAKKG